METMTPQTNPVQPNPQQVESPPQAPVQSPKPAKSNSLLIMGVFLIAVLGLGVVGFLAYQNYQLKQELSETQEPPVIIPSPKPTQLPTFPTVSSPIPTTQPESTIPADWKTYRNEEYEFEIRHPKEYLVVKKEDGIILEKVKIRPLLYLQIMNNKGNLAAKQWLDSQSPQMTQPLFEAHTLSNININNYQALKLTKKQSLKDYQDFIIIISNNKNVYYFNFGPKIEEFNLAHQILSTFKFLE